MRLCASILLVLGLVLMPVAMSGQTASAAPPMAGSTVSGSSCPDHHEPAAPDAPARKGLAHCAACVALPQADLDVAQPPAPVSGVVVAVLLPHLAGIMAAVTDPPPKPV